MVTLNPITFAAVAEKAAHDAANHPRWLTAIGRAILELDSNPWIERQADGHGLLIGSPSAAVYSANGVCQCTAYTGMLNGKQVHAGKLPCWHRAAARLVRLCDEREAAQRQIICQQPDNLCELHNPCPEHAAQAATYLEAEAITEAQRTGLITMPEGDTLDTAGMRIARKIAAARATAQLNELFA